MCRNYSNQDKTFFVRCWHKLLDVIKSKASELKKPKNIGLHNPEQQNYEMTQEIKVGINWQKFAWRNKEVSLGTKVLVHRFIT